MIVINRCNGTCRYLMKFTHDYANTCKDPRGIRNYVFVTSRTMFHEDGYASLLSWENKDTYEISREKRLPFVFSSNGSNRNRSIVSNYLIQPTFWTTRQRIGLFFIFFKAFIFKKFEIFFFRDRDLNIYKYIKIVYIDRVE